MIEARNLYKAFNKVVAVEEVSLKAEDGQITGLLGPNGAGKSTALRMLYTLLKPDKGQAQVDGLDTVQQAGAVRARLGVLPDAPGLYTRLTAIENIRYFGQLQGMGGKELEERVKQLVDELELGAVASRQVGGFSQGERMKVAVARALIHRPQNLILDEPTNGLDVMSTRALRARLKLERDAGRCIIFSSHIMQEVAALADTIVIIARGRVVASGTPAELLEQAKQTSLEEAFVSLIGEQP
jgi:sodium transport system ATP-binding protein